MSPDPVSGSGSQPPQPWRCRRPHGYDQGMTVYSAVVRPLAFRFDPETVHHLAIAAGARLGWAAGAMRSVTRLRDKRLSIDIAGLHFQSPIGLAAGFDKSGMAIAALASLGFGSVEIGS